MFADEQEQESGPRLILSYSSGGARGIMTGFVRGVGFQGYQNMSVDLKANMLCSHYLEYSGAVYGQLDGRVVLRSNNCEEKIGDNNFEVGMLHGIKAILLSIFTILVSMEGSSISV